jgi:hypothetical protein
VQQLNVNASESRTPAANVAVIVNDQSSAEAAETAGIRALYVEDVAHASADEILPKLDDAEAAIVLAPAGITKEEARPFWTMARALREAGHPAIGWYCRRGKKNGPRGLAGWIEKDGAGAVREVLDQATAKAVERLAQIPVGGYVAVGYDGDRSVVWSVPRQSLHVLGPRDLGDAMLQTICGAAWCAANYTAFNERGTARLDLAQLRGELIDACRNAGTYSSKEIRGAGCWRVAPGVLAVNSNKLWRTDGQSVERVGVDCVYPVSADLGLAPDVPEATDAEAREVLEFFRMWRWRNPGDATLLFGWLAQAPVVGALERRPHLIVTGAAGGGKTTLLDGVSRLLGGRHAALKGDGASTAAGIRQKLKHGALAIIMDELESKTDQGAARVRLLIEQMRSAYSDGTGHGVLRGTADGVGTAYSVRYSALLSMIVPPAMEAADRTRFATLNLLPLPRGVRIPALALDEARVLSLGARLRMRIVRHYAELIESIASVRGALISRGYSPRLGDTLGGLLGAAYVLLHGQALCDEFDIITWVKDANIAQHAAAVETASDEDECAAWLLGASVRINDEMRTVAEAAQTALDEIASGEGRKTRTVGRALERVGVKVYADSIAVACSDLEGLRTVFRSSKFAGGGWSVVLARLPGAREAVVRVGGVNTRVVQIPLDAIKAFAREPRQHDLELHTDNVHSLRSAGYRK